MTDDEQITASFQLTVAGRRVAVSVEIPKGPARPRALLPLMQEVTNLVVSVAEEREVKAGRTISCAAGCGACCRQLVPIAPTEAHEIAALVDAMPAPRQGVIRQRFSDAAARLKAAGMTDDLQHIERIVGDRVTPFGLQYFHQGIACPFLENEACSIHANRPLACREYLVTSDPRFCAEPETEQVQGVELNAKVSRVLRRMDRDARPEQTPYVPLIMALEWAARNPDEAAERPGPDLLRAFVDHLV